jgi:hypothetical protein
MGGSVKNPTPSKTNSHTVGLDDALLHDDIFLGRSQLRPHFHGWNTSQGRAGAPGAKSEKWEARPSNLSETSRETAWVHREVDIGLALMRGHGSGSGTANS